MDPLDPRRLDPSEYDPIYQPGVAFLRGTNPTHPGLHESEERMGVSLAGTAPEHKHRKRRVVRQVIRHGILYAGILIYVILCAAAFYLALSAMNGAK